MKKLLIVLVCIIAQTIFFSCKKAEDQEESQDFTVHESTDDYIWSTTTEVPIVLSNNGITENSDGVSVSGSKITITKAGNYTFSRTLAEGQIIVNTEDEQTVRLILNGVNITCQNNPPIFIQKSEKTVIYLADNTENFVSDGSSYSVSDEEINAAIYSKSPLTIFGNGKLNVSANYLDGITSKDGLIIASGTISVSAKDLFNYFFIRKIDYWTNV